jgi:multicomponent Na+:H+ antiporter subunit G
VHSVVLVLLFLSGSSLLFFLGAAAMLRLPDVYTRLNVLTKSLALGMAGVAAALLAQTPGYFESAKILAVWGIIYAAGRLARRWVLRRADAQDIPPWEL